MIEIMTTAKFSIIIEDLVIEKQITYMDAVLHYCEKNNMEIEQAAKLVNQRIKKRLKVEAENLNFLPKPKDQLPL